jgi:branched-chain amino acid transport system ATP-binding protein
MKGKFPAASSKAGPPGHAPEGRRIFPRLTVRENLELGGFAQDDGARVRRDIDEACGLFPVLGERMGQLGGTLSGGEQQMLALARALVGRPRLLLLDEPSLGLAPLIVARIFEVIAGLTTRGIAVMLVEQNARAALKLAARGYVLETGRITLTGSGPDLAADPRVRDAYLGE